MRVAFAIARPRLLRRGAEGFTRRCHGDLHLRNIALIEGEPVLFDAIEFSDAIASGDVLYDLAFLLMDMEERGMRPVANRLFNAYLAPEPPEGLTGLSALPFFLSLRAAIRAKVDAAGADRLEGRTASKRPSPMRAIISNWRANFFAIPRRGSSRSAACPGRARARWPAGSRPGSAARRARSGCEATSSAS